MINFIDLIFYILNLCALIFLGLYVFKKYFSRSIQSKIEQEENYLKILKEDVQDTRIQQKQIEQEILNQQELSKQLELKIQLWNDRVEQANKDKELKFNQYKIKQDSLLEVASNNFNLKKEQKLLTPIIIKDLEKIALQHFANNEDATNYLDKIIINLHKS